MPASESVAKKTKLTGSFRRLSLRVSSALSNYKTEEPEANTPSRRGSVVFGNIAATAKDSLKRVASIQQAHRLSVIFSLAKKPEAAPGAGVTTATTRQPKHDTMDTMFINIAVLGDAMVGKSAIIK